MSHRNNPRPVPFYAVDNYLVASMHLEIRALHGLLLDAADSLGISPEDIERAITYREREIAAETDAERWRPSRRPGRGDGPDAEG